MNLGKIEGCWQKFSSATFPLVPATCMIFISDIASSNSRILINDWDDNNNNNQN
jgi:hypothetical protein